VRNGEKFICTNCGNIDDANLQSARNVKKKAIALYGLNIIKVFKKKVRGDSPKPVQTTLFDVGMYERTADNRVLLKRSKRPVAVNQGEQLSLFDLDILA
jgi:putative transposase